MSRVSLLNIEVDNVSMAEAIDAIINLVKINKNSYVVTPNVDHIVQIEQGGELKKAYSDASLILTDGMPLVWISKWFGTPVKEKVSGSDLFPRLCERAAKDGYSMYFLGAGEGVADRAAQRLKNKYNGLNVVGTYSPVVGFDQDEETLKHVIEMIKGAHPDILILALGCPKQELFAWKYREALGVPVSIGLGASIDFEAGNVKRAPKWMSRVGLEWFYRLLQEPKRMFKRYLIDDMKIFGIAIKYKCRMRKKNR